MTLAKNAAIWRELDSVRVVGRDRPVVIFEPMAEAGMETPEQVAVCDAYAEGLKRWRDREFADAAKAFNRVADLDPPAALFRARALKLVQGPPAADWSAVHTLESK